MSKANKVEQVIAQVELEEQVRDADVVVEVTETPTPAQLIAQYDGPSAAIRALTALGHPRGVVAKMLNKRYQHVRNVLITPLKRDELK